MLHINLLKLISYLYPAKYKSFQSEYSSSLELTFYNGKLVLNTANTNYSYGNLQKILDKSISEIYNLNFNTIQNILVLGVAGGSVIETLCTKYNYKNTIDAVDIDPVVLAIATDFFKINRFKNCNLIEDDARNFVSKCTKKYKLIIIDLFLDDKIPSFVYDNLFMTRIKALLDIDGYIILNTISLDNKKNKINDFIFANFGTNYKIEVLNKIDSYNILYLIKML